MSLVIDVERLRRGRGGDELAFVLWASFDTEPDAADLRRVAAQVSAEYGGENAPHAEQWIKSVRGWSGVLVGADRFQDGIRWMQLFADAYGDTIDGVAAGQTRLSGGALGTVPRGPVTAVALATGDLTSVPKDIKTLAVQTGILDSTTIVTSSNDSKIFCFTPHFYGLLRCCIRPW